MAPKPVYLALESCKKRSGLHFKHYQKSVKKSGVQILAR